MYHSLHSVRPSHSGKFRRASNVRNYLIAPAYTLQPEKGERRLTDSEKNVSAVRLWGRGRWKRRSENYSRITSSLSCRRAGNEIRRILILNKRKSRKPFRRGYFFLYIEADFFSLQRTLHAEILSYLGRPWQKFVFYWSYTTRNKTGVFGTRSERASNAI